MNATRVIKNVEVNQVSSGRSYVRSGSNLIGFFIGDRALMTKEEIKAYHKAYYLANFKKIKIYRKAYRLANCEKEKARHKTYRLANLEKVKAGQKDWYLANIKKHKAYKKTYRLANREKARVCERKYRALKLNNHHEPYTETYIFERDNWQCGICGRKINRRLKFPHPRSKSIDHIIALSKGGADAPINLQAAHLRCNMSKNSGSGGQLRLLR